MSAQGPLEPLSRMLESLLFLSPDPVSAAALAAACEVEEADVLDSLTELKAGYEDGGRGILLREVAGGWALSSNPESEEAARRLFAAPRTPPLTAAQAETLAIVAYLQPVSRPEIARIRGVNAESAAALLLERGLIEESGRSAFGAVLYRTSELFLRLFGLESLETLPDISAWDPSPEVETALRERLLDVGAQRSGEPVGDADDGAAQQLKPEDAPEEDDPSVGESSQPVSQQH